ncbi:hypothetical protein [Desulfatitalea tepidiphila]|uniref:hypothetical protein n=1 Tax=Desulfatitalea tepidiphila TaxID=1185843 RepID=UPI00128F9E69|nr:hypothetical protein [Desulfatitalea tepidiphila]
MDKDTLTFLLKGGHMNVPDRVAKGIWPHPPLNYNEVRAHLVSLITQTEWFPCDLSKGKEGVVIQNTGKNYICHILHYSAFGAPIVSEKREKAFKKPEDAADFYLKWDLYLPGDLDSWKVE